MTAAIQVTNLTKQYKNGFQAVDDISLEVKEGEIFALLGPNGAGKTTLISMICGLVNPSSGSINIFGHDNQKAYKQARSQIGLVPQELTTDAFEKVINTLKFSRGLFGKKPDDAYLESLLKRLSLWDKRDQQLRTLSGGMKRRVMIAKALSHEPKILFLDEPTAGVDVELRKSMWQQVKDLREDGATIFLTTHYIEEAEQMADRIGVISAGKLLISDNKQSLMDRLGKKQLLLELYEPIANIPDAVKHLDLSLENDGNRLIFTYDATNKDNGVITMLDQLKAAGIKCQDFNTRQTSLEEIFVDLVGAK
ncbi:MAG: ABC transporter ATP-binding protein [Alphaproteobacteria bacterium]